MAIRVYVDAKIKGMHEKTRQKTAYVGYFVKGSGQCAAKRVDAGETDDAEIKAILFAISEFSKKVDRVTIVCDHESVVSETRKDVVNRPSPLLVELREALKANPSVKLEAREPNPAHRIITEYVNQLEQNTAVSTNQ